MSSVQVSQATANVAKRLQCAKMGFLRPLMTGLLHQPLSRLIVLQDPNKRSFHFCIVNLVIGTLYCVKGNYEFGIARIIKSMEPESKKLEADTWFYAKRCFLALLEGVAKHMITLKVGVPPVMLPCCDEHGCFQGYAEFLD